MTGNLFTFVTILAVAALLVAEKLGSRPGVAITKMAAASGYIAVALTLGALDSGYGTGILVGLVFSWFGDLFLIPDEAPRIFQAGIGSFLLGHVAYAVAFTQLGIDLRVCAIATVVVIAIAFVVMRWLGPHVGDDMRIPVRAYVLVISAMLVTSAGCASANDRPDVFIGALLFYLSDLAVARDRFVAPGFSNRVWGLPFYFAGQLVLAASVA